MACVVLERPWIWTQRVMLQLLTAAQHLLRLYRPICEWHSQMQRIHWNTLAPNVTVFSFRRACFSLLQAFVSPVLLRTLEVNHVSSASECWRRLPTSQCPCPYFATISYLLCSSTIAPTCCSDIYLHKLGIANPEGTTHMDEESSLVGPCVRLNFLNVGKFSFLGRCLVICILTVLKNLEKSIIARRTLTIYLCQT